jgi:hypothetical protein
MNEQHSRAQFVLTVGAVFAESPLGLDKWLAASAHQPVVNLQTRLSTGLKLWMVTLRGGFAGSLATDYKTSFVVAPDPTLAVYHVIQDLTERNIGFLSDRVLESVVLVAEDESYPACGTRLYAPKSEED